jgi:Protein of unknown function (DUF2934)
MGARQCKKGEHETDIAVFADPVLGGILKWKCFCGAKEDKPTVEPICLTCTKGIVDVEVLERAFISMDEEQLQVAAYYCWERRGCPIGSPGVDWRNAKLFQRRKFVSIEERYGV